MKRWGWRLALLGALALSLAGCFDLETEIKLLPDGSGFVTVWVRMQTRQASIGAALQGSSLAAEKKAILARLDEVFVDVAGVRLVERRIYEEGDAQTLRYRYAFDSPELLTRFWADAENAKQDVTIAGARLDFARDGADCNQTYRAEAVFAPKPVADINAIGAAVLRRQPPEVREQLVDEYYKGRFRLRLVLPGQSTATDAEQVDTAGYPIWQKRVLEVYRGGLTARASAKLTCDAEGARRPAPEESPPAPTVPLTEGSRPTIDDALRVLGALGDLATLELDAKVDKRSTLRVTYRLDGRAAQPLQNLVLLVWGLAPTLAADWDVRSERDQEDFTRLTLETKRALRLDETGSPVFFAGPDGEKTTFRLRLPALSSPTNLAPEAAGPVVMRVKVTMPKDIRQSNATLVEKTEARWLLTARDLQQPLVLEAFCPR